MAIFQYAADDTSYLANEARRKNAELQKGVGTAAALQAAKASSKPVLELTKVDKNPKVSSAFDSLLGPLAELTKSQAGATKTLQAQQADFNPRFQSAMLEDVGRVTSDLGAYETKLAALDAEGREGLTARETEAVKEASGFLEKYGAGRPGVGLSSDLVKIAADRTAAARLPFALQQTQFSVDLADRLARARAGVIGQRQNLLSQGYNFIRGQSDDLARPLSNALNLVGQASDTFGRLNFLGVGGETNQGPYSLPSYTPRIGGPNVSYPRSQGGGGPRPGGSSAPPPPPPPSGGRTGPPPLTMASVAEAYYQKYGFPPEADSDYSPERWASVGGRTANLPAPTGTFDHDRRRWDDATSQRARDALRYQYRRNNPLTPPPPPPPGPEQGPPFDRIGMAPSSWFDNNTSPDGAFVQGMKDQARLYPKEERLFADPNEFFNPNPTNNNTEGFYDGY